MAHIPMGDIQEIWNDTKQHSWSALHKTLQAHLDKADGISNALVVDMLEMTKDCEKSGKPYPDSVASLYNVFNANLGPAERHRESESNQQSHTH